MYMPAAIKKTMEVFRGSFINCHNELILVPQFNVYFSLDLVNDDWDIACNMCEYFSRECSYALRYESPKRLYKYYMDMTAKFNKVCGTNFTVEDMRVIYTRLGNGCNHRLTNFFVSNDFDMKLLEEE